MKKALFPGSFDPMHKGHVGIIKKASKLFDYVYVVISKNPEKKARYSLEERYKFAKKIMPKIKNVELITLDGELTAMFAKKQKCNYIIRSGRNNMDFKYEIELAAANNSLNSKLETILIMPDYSKVNYHSRLIKQTKPTKK